MNNRDFTKKISREELEIRIQKSLDVAFEWSQIDGAHHKMWTIDQMVRELTGDDYPKWVATYEIDEETNEKYEWEKGTAP